MWLVALSITLIFSIMSLNCFCCLRIIVISLACFRSYTLFKAGSSKGTSSSSFIVSSDTISAMLSSIACLALASIWSCRYSSTSVSLNTSLLFVKSLTSFFWLEFWSMLIYLRLLRTRCSCKISGSLLIFLMCLCRLTICSSNFFLTSLTSTVS